MACSLRHPSFQNFYNRSAYAIVERHFTAFRLTQKLNALTVLKDGIKAALAEGKSFRDEVRQTLAAYRTTGHSTTGVSPASLMLVFPVQTPLSLLGPGSSATANTPVTPRVAVEKRVRFQQQQAAQAHDCCTRAARTPLAAGDWV